MASAITFPAFASSPGRLQNRTFMQSFPATSTFLSLKAPFSGDAFVPVSLHARNSHFLQRVLVHATSGVVNSSETDALRTKDSAKKERNPKLTNKIASQATKLNYAEIMKYPIVTESGMTNIVKNNTLVFAVDKRADKTIIKDAATKLFKIQIKKVNTSIMPDGTKKAFLMLSPDYKAADVAKRIKAI